MDVSVRGLFQEIQMACMTMVLQLQQQHFDPHNVTSIPRRCVCGKNMTGFFLTFFPLLLSSRANPCIFSQYSFNFFSFRFDLYSFYYYFSNFRLYMELKFSFNLIFWFFTFQIWSLFFWYWFILIILLIKLSLNCIIQYFILFS